MSNTRRVRQGKHRQKAYILFEGRRYYSEDLSNLVGDKLRIRRYPGNYQVIKAFRPDDGCAFLLHTKGWAAKTVTDDLVHAYLRYLQGKHLTGHPAENIRIDLRKHRE